MTDIKTELCDDNNLEQLFNNRILSFLENLHENCNELNFNVNEGEVLSGCISVMVGYLTHTVGIETTEHFLQQLIDLHKAHSGPLN